MGTLDKVFFHDWCMFGILDVSGKGQLECRGSKLGKGR